MPFLRFARLLLFVLALGLTPVARGADIALVLGDSGGAYGEFTTAFQQSLGAANWRVRWVGTVDAIEPAAYRADLIVAVGGEAARQALRLSEGRPVLATLLPRQAYERALAETPGRPRQVSAIYLDQPASRIVAFTRQLLPDRKRVGLLVGSDTRPQLAAVRQAVGAAGGTLETADLDNDAALVPILSNLLGRSDVLLALPDSSVFRRDNIRAVLLTTFRYQKPVIAFSQAFVTAGALGAVYSSPTQIARQTADVVRGLHGDGAALPAPQGPSQFSVAINRNVAQALGLSLPDEGTLQRSLAAEKDSR